MMARAFVIHLTSQNLWYGPNATEVETLDQARVFTTLSDAHYELRAIRNDGMTYTVMQIQRMPAERTSRRDRNADRIDGYDRDDLGESPDY